MPARRTIAVVLAFIALAGCGRTAAAPQMGPGEGVVTKHVDGDTLHVTIANRDETVRFIGIDTPETHGRGGLRECFGKEASARTAKLLPLGTRVRLVRDVEARDRYRRLLAYVYRAADDLFVNLELARQGYAAVLTYPPNVAHTAEFVAAAAEARAQNRGLWQRCGDADVPIT
ncbi:MAG TPA: thermonuclease family protein [Acidimicrobiales bacterium]|nr:thermonuclease family protein [Acidimicrobiales bacterium]